MSGRRRMNDKVPSEAIRLMAAIQEKGFSVYIVGGAVRDLLLGRDPKDFDLTTNARPEAVLSICSAMGWKTVNQLGQNFGVVAVVINHSVWEVATFRGESYGADAHRPELVWYGDSLEADLARRDFTINAMALTGEGQVVDRFGGQRDLELGMIRTVGDPKQRFAEDALRMFRACRFAAQLGFNMEEKTFRAFANCLGAVKGLSLERVKEELNRLLVADQVDRGLDYLIRSGLAGCSCTNKVDGQVLFVGILPELAALVNVKQNPQFHCFDVWQHTLAAVVASPAELTVRWALLLHDVAKGTAGVRGIGSDGRITDYGHDKVGGAMARAILQRLCFPRKFILRVTWIVEKHMRFHVVFYRAVVKSDDRSLKHWLREEARSGQFRDQAEMKIAFLQLAEVCFADGIGTGKSVSEHQALQQHFLGFLASLLDAMPVHTHDLQIKGKEIAELACESRLIGTCLQVLLRRVQDGELKNEVSILQLAARKWLSKS